MPLPSRSPCGRVSAPTSCEGTARGVQAAPVAGKVITLCPRAACSAYECPRVMLTEQLLQFKNKSSSLPIVCTYWPLLPSSQTHLWYSQKPSACLFSLLLLAGINAALVTHCLCRDICKLSQGWFFFSPTGDKILYNYRCFGDTNRKMEIRFRCSCSWRKGKIKIKAEKNVDMSKEMTEKE